MIAKLFRSILLTIVMIALLSSTAQTGGPVSAASTVSIGTPTDTPNPVLFVTQVPIPADFTTIASTFGNHDPQLQAVGRGGDLWIRYEDGVLKNLTEAAGYGNSGFQGAASIAVRDPHVHWDGDKALFSMVIGATTEQWAWETYYWQMYEITGLDPADTPAITKVPNQPATYNNVAPAYTSDDQIIFTSDRPRNGAAHLYPQLDEYESAAVVTGIWKLNPATGLLQLLNHAPSGDFEPFVDSFGRIVFTQWDHLQRDQQADADNLNEHNGQPCDTCAYNYSDESAGAAALVQRTEVFPEPRADLDLEGTNLWGHTINHFFPWVMNQDGVDMEVLNHIGRHELHSYIPPSLTDDPNLIEYYGQYPRFNANAIDNMFQIEESPLVAGRYLGTNAPEFHTHASGQIISIDGPPDLDADHMAVTYLTHPDTADYTDSPGPDHSGMYRDPLPLSDGAIVVAHTAETRADTNTGSREHPQSRYDFRLKLLAPAANGYQEASAALTGGISKTISYWDPDYLVHYSGVLWELQPVEVRARPRPAQPTTPLPAIEQDIFDQTGVELTALQTYLRANNLALLVSRNVTTRDDLDHQQPFNLRVTGASTQTLGAGGKIYDISDMQFYQGDQIRAYGWDGSGAPPESGRRVIAQVMHDPAALAANPPNAGGPAGSVALGDDGSMAAFVPARRALSWQLTDPSGVGVVRERYWLTFQPGEVRVCTSCHGLNEYDQAGQAAPTNPPQALEQLLTHWKTNVDDPDGNPGDDFTLYLPVITVIN